MVRSPHSADPCTRSHSRRGLYRASACCRVNWPSRSRLRGVGKPRTNPGTAGPAPTTTHGLGAGEFVEGKPGGFPSTSHPLSEVSPGRQSLSSRRVIRVCGVHSELQLSELPQLGPVDGNSVKRLTWPVCYSSAVRIAIRVPAMNERGPQYMEQAIAAIHQANPRRLPIHLEFGHHHETVALTCSFPPELRTAVEQQLFVQYPD